MTTVPAIVPTITTSPFLSVATPIPTVVAPSENALVKSPVIDTPASDDASSPGDASGEGLPPSGELGTPESGLLPDGDDESLLPHPA